MQTTTTGTPATRGLVLELKLGPISRRFVRVDGSDRAFVIGSSPSCDLRLKLPDSPGCQALIFQRGDSWVIADLSGEKRVSIQSKSILEFHLKHGTEIQIGDFTLVAHLGADPIDEMAMAHPFRDSTEVKTLPLNGLMLQAVIRSRGHIIDTVTASAHEPFLIEIAGEKKFLPVPKDQNWVRHQFGQRTFDLRLIELQKAPVDQPRDSDSILYKAAGVTFLVFLMLFMITLMISKFTKNPETALDRKSMEMIYSAKTIQKKREESAQNLKVAVKRQSPKNQAQNNQTAPAELTAGTATAPKAATQKAQKAIASLRSSGLQSLVGKIAKRASQNGVFVVAQGIQPDEVGSGRAIASIGKSKVGGGGSAAEGKTLRLGGISTQGKAGGVANAGSGQRLVAGGIGLGATVSFEDDETIIDGGLDREAINEVIKRNIGQIRYCYERQLSSNPELYGKVVVKFAINAAGGVLSPAVDSSTMRNDLIEGCITRRIGALKFPLPKGGTEVRVTYPFLFKSVQ